MWYTRAAIGTAFTMAWHSEQLAQLQASDAVELSYAAQVLGYAELEGGMQRG